MNQRDRIRNDLRDHGLRCTRQREEILLALRATTQHPTADQVFDMVAPAVAGLSLATVYNTLDALTAAGLCRRLPTAHGAATVCRYDADTSDHVHVTTPDGRMVDVPAELGRQLLAGLSPTVLEQIERHLGVHVATVRVVIESEQAG